MVIQSLELLADGQALLSAGSDERLQLCSSLLEPSESFMLAIHLSAAASELSRNMLLSLSLFKQVSDALLHLLVTHYHTETELAESSNNELSRCRTLTLSVLCIWVDGTEAEVDRRTIVALAII